MQVAIYALIILATIYFVVFAIFAIGLLFYRDPNSSKNQTIPLSIVVAVRNEEANIDKLLISILKQDYPAEDFEIILVNDHSTDNTWPMAKKWAEQHANIQLAELPIHSEGKKQAVAWGISLAKNDTVVLTDADCTHPTSWLRNIALAYQTKKAHMLIGPVMISPTNTFFEKMQALEHASLTASSIGACGVGLPFMASAANLSFNKSMLGFEQQMLNPKYASGDDVFLLHSAKRRKGFRISPLKGEGALVFTQPVKSVGKFLAQRARWASKSTGYTDFTAIAVGFTVLLFNLLLVALAVLSFWNIAYLKVLGLGYVVKSIADLLLLIPYLSQHKKLSLLYVFIPLQLVYPIYIVIAFAMAMLTNTRWKRKEMLNLE
jgi:cellulose synthase/poly-beta-1,6-N-acetylglucosamine synthase-like glycosyltransferase